MSDNKNSKNNNRPFWQKVVLNLLAMFAICVGLFLITAYWLDLWTHHGAEITVPNVKGMSYDDARALLEDQDFEVVLQDSVYEEKIKPGTVIEMSPRDSAVVKPGRTVYLTINAFYPRTIAMPVLTDISERQAMIVLEGYGFKNVSVHRVPSEYDGLVFGVMVNGKRVKPGSRVPLTAKILLEVGMGAGYTEPVADSAAVAPENIDAEQAEHNPDTHVSEPEATISTTNPSDPSPDDTDPDLFD